MGKKNTAKAGERHKFSDNKNHKAANRIFWFFESRTFFKRTHFHEVSREN